MRKVQLRVFFCFAASWIKLTVYNCHLWKNISPTCWLKIVLLCFWKTSQYKRAKTVIDFLFARQNLMISNVNKIIVVLELNDYKPGGKTQQKKPLGYWRTWIFCETENYFGKFSVFLFIFYYFLLSHGIKKKIANICGRLKKPLLFGRKGTGTETIWWMSQGNYFSLLNYFCLVLKNIFLLRNEV